MPDAGLVSGLSPPWSPPGQTHSALTGLGAGRAETQTGSVPWTVIRLVSGPDSDRTEPPVRVWPGSVPSPAGGHRLRLRPRPAPHGAQLSPGSGPRHIPRPDPPGSSPGPRPTPPPVGPHGAGPGGAEPSHRRFRGRGRFRPFAREGAGLPPALPSPALLIGCVPAPRGGRGAPGSFAEAGCSAAGPDRPAPLRSGTAPARSA